MCSCRRETAAACDQERLLTKQQQQERERQGVAVRRYEPQPHAHSRVYSAAACGPAMASHAVGRGSSSASGDPTASVGSQSAPLLPPTHPSLDQHRHSMPCGVPVRRCVGVMWCATGHITHSEESARPEMPGLEMWGTRRAIAPPPEAWLDRPRVATSAGMPNSPLASMEGMKPSPFHRWVGVDLNNPHSFPSFTVFGSTGAAPPTSLFPTSLL